MGCIALAGEWTSHNVITGGLEFFFLRRCHLTAMTEAWKIKTKEQDPEQQQT